MDAEFESQLGGARKFVDKFKSRFQERRGNKDGEGETINARLNCIIHNLFSMKTIISLAIIARNNSSLQ